MRLAAPIRIAAWACIATACSGALRSQSAEALNPYQVEAAFLLNFTRFIEWPNSAFRDGASPFTICILGDDAFGGAIDQIVEGETVAGRQLRIERRRSAPAPHTCQVLYIGSAEKNVAALVAEAGSGVLTVSDRPEFLRQGGIIAFAIENRHVRFDINLKAAGKASLRVSSRLLGVARFVMR